MDGGYEVVNHVDLAFALKRNNHSDIELNKHQNIIQTTFPTVFLETMYEVDMFQ